MAFNAAVAEIGVRRVPIRLGGKLICALALAHEHVGLWALARPPSGAGDVVGAGEHVVGHVFAGLVTPHAGVAGLIAGRGAAVRSADRGALLHDRVVIRSTRNAQWE